MSVEKRQIDAPPGTDEIVEGRRFTDPKRSPVTSVISEAYSSDGCKLNSSSSHPGLLALARVLGRNAARAEMRKARRGAMLLELTDSLLVVAALIVGALVWSIVAGIR